MEPYFKMDAGFRDSGAVTVELMEDPLNPGGLMLEAAGGRGVIRLRLPEEKAVRLSTAIFAWYNRPETVATDEEVATDIITEFRDGIAYSFTAPPEV